MTVRLILVDDHELIRIGLASQLADNDIEIIAEAANGLEAIEKTKQLEPDVVLMGVGMPEMDGFDALERIRTEAPSVKVILMSAHENATYVSRAAALGAADFSGRMRRPKRLWTRSIGPPEAKNHRPIRF